MKVMKTGKKNYKKFYLLWSTRTFLHDDNIIDGRWGDNDVDNYVNYYNASTRTCKWHDDN